MNNIDATKAIVAAYLSEDAEGVLMHRADDVEWEYGSANDIPWYRARRGKAEVADVFKSLDEVDLSNGNRSPFGRRGPDRCRAGFRFQRAIFETRR